MFKIRVSLPIFLRSKKKGIDMHHVSISFISISEIINLSSTFEAELNLSTGIISILLIKYECPIIKIVSVSFGIKCINTF